jgi:hypothetical protein
MRVIVLSVVIITFLIFSNGSADTAKDFGIVMDISGKVQMKRGADAIFAEIGLNIIKGDVIEVKEEDSIVFVSYDDC